MGYLDFAFLELQVRGTVPMYDADEVLGGWMMGAIKAILDAIRDALAPQPEPKRIPIRVNDTRPGPRRC